MANLQKPPALHRALSSLTTCQVLMLNQTSGVTYKRCTPPVLRASAQGDAVVLCKQGYAAAFLSDCQLFCPSNFLRFFSKFSGRWYCKYFPGCWDWQGQGRTARREFLDLLGILTASAILTDTALAEKTPKGYQAVLDKFDGYTFLYPFGWQEVVVNGQDKTYKDVIEPLESVSVSIVPTSKTDIHELGPPEEVAETLVKKVLSSSTQKTKLVNVKERTAEGRNYYTFEFVAKAPNYTRHALGTVAIGNGKFYTLTTGANERRWGKMEDKLRTVAESLTLFNV